MRKRIQYVLLVAALLSTLTLVCVAHSGKTDGSGGHYNRSTGEYHYHHGYSAHDHYDMDGDGDKDCPYSFADQTNKGNSDNSSYTTRTTRRTATTTIVNHQKKRRTWDAWSLLTIGIISLFVLPWIVSGVFTLITEVVAKVVDYIKRR